MSKHDSHKHEKPLQIKKENPFLSKLKQIYVKDYRKLFMIVVALTLFAIGSVIFTYMQAGDFTRRDVSLKGGISLTITTPYNDIPTLESFLNDKFPKSSINIRTLNSGNQVIGLIIEASDLSDKDLLDAVQEKTGALDKKGYSLEIMGSALGESFFKEMFAALALAFVCMGLVFHFYFRNIYSTAAALLSAFLDIFITLGIMNAIGLRLTAGGIAAYLMLIGYSIDTSILLSTKLLKEKKEHVDDALFGAMKTGLTMSAAGLASTIISFFLTNNLVLKQIMLILVVGLLADILTTWIGNVTLLRLFLEKKHAQKSRGEV
jgi:preprotein translocase subunit SecF